MNVVRVASVADAARPSDLTPGPRSARRRWVWGAAWLFFLAGAVHDGIARNGPVGASIVVVGYLIFAALYIVAIPLFFPRPPRDVWRLLLPVAMLLDATSLLPLAGENGLAAYVFIAITMIMLWPALAAGLGVLALCVASAVLLLTVDSWHGDLSDVGGVVVPILVGSFAMVGVLTLIQRNRELIEAREEIARLAVGEERLRFARDLHDLLGHSLTVITVKSQLAGRLLDRDPERAAAEVADIERLARDALADVRTTVTGYREVTLAAELASARTALLAAGIRPDLPGAIEEVPGQHRELFGWVVREGVTNVVRHSRATQCRVRITPISVEIEDDGRGCPGVPGTGLRGLRERIAAAGGTLEAAGSPLGGFRLCAKLPG